MAICRKDPKKTECYMNSLNKLLIVLKTKRFEENDRENDRKIMLKKITRLAEVANNLFSVSALMTPAMTPETSGMSRNGSGLEGGKKRKGSKKGSKSGSKKGSKKMPKKGW